ncbi:DUF305 domain-containing protein [Nitriliruptoraceae bacterium ZYF776]|nr:DUF305 domain-containing protein [Profundirhabdus halotolerans]
MTRRTVLAWATAITLVAVTVVTVAVVARDDRAPVEESVDVGFARDMAVHHAQGVEIAELIRGRTDDHRIAALAADIALRQQAQIGRMQGWLALWGHDQTAVGPRMAWMGRPRDGLMPGMATRAELNALADAEGDDAERRFLELMIGHHVAGVEMAQVAAAEAQVTDVRRLAAAMAAGQRAEIDAMRQLLVEGRPPEAASA